MYDEMFFQVGRCTQCTCRRTMVVSAGLKRNSGVCMRCDPDLFNKVAELQKDRWLRGDPIQTTLSPPARS